MKKFIGIMAVLTVIFGITAAANAAQITEAQAKEIALKHAGVTVQQANFTKMKLDRDFGRTEYELEFFVGNVEYDYEIDAADGTVRKFSRETHAAAPFQNGGQPGQPAQGLIGEQKAMEILPRVRVRDQRRDRRGSGLGDRLVRGRNELEPALRRLFSYRPDGARFARGAYNRDEGCAEGAVR